jgi:hypothetical protein
VTRTPRSSVKEESQAEILGIFKGSGSLDGLEIYCHAWIDLGLKKGGKRVLYLSDAHSSQNFVLYFSHGKCESHSACLVIGLYLVKILLLLIGQGSRPLLPIDLRNLQILCQHI